MRRVTFICIATILAATGLNLNARSTHTSFNAIGEETYGHKAANACTYGAQSLFTNVLATNLWRTDFRYDGLGRKRVRRDYTWTGSAWHRTNEVRYIYDGFLVFQERNSNNIPRVSYTRGADLSGDYDGAGGVGGLLGMTTHVQTTNYTHYFYHSDALGNITALQNTARQTIANYMYSPFGGDFDPFGPAMFATGPSNHLNRMRFAGKEWHPQTGLHDFGARFYNPTLQRWLNEDPLGIAGGLNLYTYVGNSPLNYVDPWGLYSEDADLDARLEIVGEFGAFFATYNYDEPTRERYAEIWDESWNDVKEWAKRTAQEAAEELAWNICPVGAAIRPFKGAIKKAAEEGVEQLGKVLTKAATVRSHSELIKDFTQTPQNWERVRSQVSQTTRRGQQGGVNIESIWRNKQTGETLSTHEAFGPGGKSIHPENPSPNLPGGGAIRPGNRSKIEP